MHRLRGDDSAEVLSIETALYQAAHDYPGGIPALAGATGCNARTLQNMLNIGSDAKPTLKVFRDTLNATRDRRIVQAVLHPINWIGVPLSDLTNVSDVELLDAVNKIVSRVGETTGDLMQSLSDGEIDDQEIAELEGDVDNAVQALQEFLLRVRALHSAARTRKRGPR